MGAERKSAVRSQTDAIDPSATLGSTQESARSHLIGGMVRPGGDVLTLRAYVQLPQHVSDELLVRQASWRCPAGERPARVVRSGRPVASVAWSPATAGAKRTQRLCGVCY